jgi:hypothetical protein
MVYNCIMAKSLIIGGLGMTRKAGFSFFSRNVVWFVFALLLYPLGLNAAEIMTNDGQKFDGKILEEQTDSILMEIENGVHVRIEKV